MPQTPFGTPFESAPPPASPKPKQAQRGFGTEIDPGQAPPKRQDRPQAPQRGFGTEVDPSQAPARREGQAPSQRGFGAEVDPSQAPPKRQPPPTPERASLQPIEMPPPGSGVMAFKTVALGLVQNESPPNLPPGATPTAQNVLAREGVLEPRFRLAALGSGSSLMDDVLALGEYANVAGTRYPYAISAATFSYYSGSAWTFGSYAANGVNDPPSGADTNYLDSTVLYDPVSDENAVVWVNGLDQAFVASAHTRGFSSLTNAPIAKTVAVWDSRVLFGNITSGATTYAQRIIHSEKFNPSITTTPTGGQDDLMDARGGLQRLMPDGERVLAFFDHEIWYGYRQDFPFNVQYDALDRTVGCSGAWTVCQTPKGVFFLGDDYMPRLLPRGGTPQPVGQAIWKTLRDEIDHPERATADYNPETGEVLLAYAIQGGTGRCDRGLALDLATGLWTPQTFGIPLTRVAQGNVPTSAVTWGGLVGSWQAQTKTWAQLGGTSTKRGLLAGTSTGTVAVLDSGATGDLRTAVDTRYLVVMPNEDPSRKQYVREVRLDYRAASASSLTLRLSADFGASFGQAVGVALPAAPVSGQTVVHVGLEAVYPTIQFQHDQGHRFAIQRCIAQVAPTGRG